jgi:hypothetical protein
MVFITGHETKNSLLCQANNFHDPQIFFSMLFFVILGRPRRRWEDGIRMDFREITGEVDWFRLARDRDRWRAVLNAAMNLQYCF